MEIVEIEAIKSDQLDDIHKLIRQLSSGAALPRLEDFNSMYGGGGAHLIAALDGQQIVGMLTLVLIRIPTGLRARIEDVVVLESCRRQGLAKRMSEIAIKLYQKSGARTLDLTSSPSRIAANQLYLALGFEARETNVYRFKG